MKCLKCGFENSEGSKVCISCGNVLSGGGGIASPAPEQPAPIVEPTPLEQPVAPVVNTEVPPVVSAEQPPVVNNEPAQPVPEVVSNEPVAPEVPQVETTVQVAEQPVVTPVALEVQQTTTVPEQPATVTPEQQPVNNEQVQPAATEKKDNKIKVIIIVIVAALVIAIAGFGLSKLMGGGSSGGDSEEKVVNTPKAVAEEFMKAWTNKNATKMMKLIWYDEDDYTEDDIEEMVGYMTDSDEKMTYKFKKEVSKGDSVAKEKFELISDDGEYNIVVSLKKVDGNWKVNIAKLDIDYE